MTYHLWYWFHLKNCEHPQINMELQIIKMRNIFIYCVCIHLMAHALHAFDLTLRKSRLWTSGFRDPVMPLAPSHNHWQHTFQSQEISWLWLQTALHKAVFNVYTDNCSIIAIYSNCGQIHGENYATCEFPLKQEVLHIPKSLHVFYILDMYAI